MSRILLVLSSSFHGRTFVASGLTDVLRARGHRLTIAARADVRAALEARGDLDDVVELEPVLPGATKRLLRDAFRTASYVHRSDFPGALAYRAKLARRPSLRKKLASDPLRWRRRDVRALALALLEACLIRTAPRRRLEQRIRALERWLPVARAARRLIEDRRPDVLVAPTAIQDALDVELVKAARQAGVPVIGVPASWDTLGTKGCFLVPPDVLLVWGEDTFRHAVELHGFAPDRVVVTGPPHFDIYAPTFPVESRAAFLRRRGIDPAARVLLYAGTTVTYWNDEPLQVRALSELIARGALGNAVVWYRPHPRRAYRDIREFQGLPGVHVDDVLLRQKRGGEGYSLTAADLPHHRALLETSEGVVTAFSTMIVEAALLGKPSLVVGFGLADGTPERVLQHAEYHHMTDVLKTPGITLARSLDELVAGIHRLLAGDFAACSEALRKRAGEIARCQDGRARERMVEAIERVAAEGRGR